MSDFQLPDAGRVQTFYVSRDGKRVHGLTASSWFDPLEAPGGDLWLLKDVGRTDSLVLVGDATGHGPGAGMVTALIAGSTEMARLGMGAGMQPFMLANLLSHCLLGTVDGELLMTAVLGRFDPDKRRLTFVNAGHPAPRLIRNGTVSAVQSDGQPPLGSMRTHRYEHQTLDLFAGDMLVLFSDGITEAVGRDDEQYGERRLHALLEKHAGSGADAIRDAMRHAIGQWSDELDDDITFVVLTVD